MGINEESNVTEAICLKELIIMSNIHSDCEYYVPENDMCLLYFELGFHNISQYNTCVEKEAYPDG